MKLGISVFWVSDDGSVAQMDGDWMRAIRPPSSALLDAAVAHLPRASGIYAIVNKVTRERYVGQAKGKPAGIRGRVRQHIRELEAGRHFEHITRRWLQDAWNKYGRDAFEFVVLEQVDDNSKIAPYPDNLSLAEQWYINEKSEYNPDKGIVRAEFAYLVKARAWVKPS